MDETPREPPLAPGERIEHHEVTQRVAPGTDPVAQQRRGSPMWPWLLPLVILAIALVWYVLSRGDPASPVDAIDDVEIQAPDVDVEP
jgi:hypothetical protein